MGRTQTIPLSPPSIEVGGSLWFIWKVLCGSIPPWLVQMRRVRFTKHLRSRLGMTEGWAGSRSSKEPHSKPAPSRSTKYFQIHKYTYFKSHRVESGPGKSYMPRSPQFQKQKQFLKITACLQTDSFQCGRFWPALHLGFGTAKAAEMQPFFVREESTAWTRSSENSSQTVLPQANWRWTRRHTKPIVHTRQGRRGRAEGSKAEAMLCSSIFPLFLLLLPIT